MLYKDIFIGTANGNSSTVQFEESINVCEVVLVGSSSLVTVTVYHSVGGRSYRKVGVLTVNSTYPSADLHVSSWPPGPYYVNFAGLEVGDTVYVSMSGE